MTLELLDAQVLAPGRLFGTVIPIVSGGTGGVATGFGEGLWGTGAWGGDPGSIVTPVVLGAGMIKVCDIGQQVRFFARIALDNVATDPSTVTLSIADPTATTTIYTWADAEIIQDSTGVFYMDYTLSLSGGYDWLWNSSGVVTASDEGELFVRKSVFG